MNTIKNLIYIFPDQMGANVTGCYGNNDISTPNIDNLASNSVLYQRAYTTCPICTPYRGCLFTGRYPMQTGIETNGLRLPDNEITIAQCMEDAGIYTSYVGKWHLSAEPACNRWVPPKDRGGFRDFIGWESHHVDHFDGKIWGDGEDKLIPMPGHESDALTDIALDKLDDLASCGNRFSMFIAYQAPHPPCSPVDKYLDMYKDKKLTFSPNVPNPAPDYNRPNWNSVYDHRTFVERYYAEISHIDDCVGRIIKRLDELGITDETIIVFTSDHGEMMGSHNRYSKSTMLEEAVRVPFIIKVPNANPRISEKLISTVDIMPTLLDLMGASLPDTIEGISHAQYISNNDDLNANSVILQEHELCLIDGSYKLIATRDNIEPIALYNLEDDPYEMINLLDNISCQEILKQGIKKIDDWKNDINTRIGDVDDAKGYAHWYRDRV